MGIAEKNGIQTTNIADPYFGGSLKETFTETNLKNTSKSDIEKLLLISTTYRSYGHLPPMITYKQGQS